MEEEKKHNTMEHKKHEQEDLNQMEEGHEGHNNHNGHEKHGGHHDLHAMMVADFRKRFFISLILMVPILILSPMIQNFMKVDFRFPGDS